MEENTLLLLLKLGGAGHLILAGGSLFIPGMLDWKNKLADADSLIRKMFWTYAAYILVLHIFFGLISLFACHELLNGSVLAFSVTLFIALYWFGRLILQFTVFSKIPRPKGLIYWWAEAGLIIAFLAFTLIYGLVAIHNA
jgi:hypothetical protein